MCCAVLCVAVPCPLTSYRRRVNYKLINRPARLGDPLIRGDVAKQENKGLFLSRCAGCFGVVSFPSCCLPVACLLPPAAAHQVPAGPTMQIALHVLAQTKCMPVLLWDPNRDDHWRHLHRVWQPVFYADSVRACAPLMESTTQRMLHRLDQLAAAGQPLDIWREVGNLTMGIVGTAAYG